LLGWILLIALLLLLALLFFTPLKIKITYNREGANDGLQINVSAWFGLIRYKVKVPKLKLDGSPQGPQLSAELRQNLPGDLRQKEGGVTSGMMKEGFAQMMDLLERVHGVRPVIRDMLRHVRIDHLEWHTAIGLGEAAETGALTGVSWSVKGMLLGALSHYVALRTSPRISVAPVWNDKCIRTRFHCILRFMLGYAMIAGIRILLKLRKGREQKWQTTPSRA